MRKILLLILLTFSLSGCFSAKPSDTMTGTGIVINAEFLESKVTDSYLDLRGLDLKTVPDFPSLFSKAMLQEVLYIDLSGNAITEIPNVFTAFPNLKELYLANNKIKKLENLNNLGWLRKLEVYSNQIEEIELKNVNALLEIDASYNKLETEDIQDLLQLTSLQFLQLQHNKITSIQGIEKLQNLQKVKLEFNEIKDVSELDKLPFLNFASIRYNPLQESVMERWTKVSQETMEKEGE